MDYKKTAELIQSARKEKGLTQLQLAEVLGVTDRAVSKWERAKSFPDVAMLQPLSDVLGITVTELLNGERISADSGITAGEAEQAAIRGIDSYVRDTRKKTKPLWVMLAVLMALLAIVGFFEYNRYSHSPTDFKTDKLEFDRLIYLSEDGQLHELELSDAFGQELKGQITAYLKNTMPTGEEITRNPGVRVNMPRVDFVGLAIFYFDCYYDYKSEKYYNFAGAGTMYDRLQGICEDIVSDEVYKYNGPTYVEKGGKYVKINCSVTEKPIEQIIQRYIDTVNRYNPEVLPGFYRSYIIDSITRLTQEEYENTDEYAEWLSKEIIYRDIYSYRIYKMQVTFIDSDSYRGSGAQFPEGTYESVFMAAKSDGSGGRYEILDEYIGNYWQVE
ncbi:MAG: helix-turn-helix transcriptional regulator [Firmicutes bacterium]|nr:helix-turn-helix transcriptional regulator [Bacillota bacterium]